MLGKLQILFFVFSYYLYLFIVTKKILLLGRFCKNSLIIGSSLLLKVVSMCCGLKNSLLAFRGIYVIYVTDCFATHGVVVL